MQGLPCCCRSGSGLEHSILVRGSITAGRYITEEHITSFCDLPEIEEEAIIVQLSDEKIEPFWKQYRCIFGSVAQTAYV